VDASEWTFGEGEEHLLFRKDVGLWDAEVEVRPAPGAEPQCSTGKSMSRLVCDDRWLVTEFRNETSGFEGHGLYGWDVARRKYVGTWVDTMTRWLVIGEGDWDPQRRTLTLDTRATMPGGREIEWRQVTELVDDDTQVYRSFVPGPGGEPFEMMKVTYRRRRA
jgi:hypothetical protein